MSKTNNLPKPLGHYSHYAVSKTGLIFVSGQLGIDKDKTVLEEGILNQTKKIFENIATILKETNTKKEDVLKATVYLKDLASFKAVNDVYQEFFQDHKPARVAFQVGKLPLDAEVEIELIIDKI